MSEAVADSIVINAAPQAGMDVIVDIEQYPAWQSDIREVEVLERDEQQRATKAGALLGRACAAPSVAHPLVGAPPPGAPWREQLGARRLIEHFLTRPPQVPERSEGLYVIPRLRKGRREATRRRESSQGEVR